MEDRDKELKAIEDAASCQAFMGLHLKLIDELMKRKISHIDAMDHSLQFLNSFYNYSNEIFCNHPSINLIHEESDIEDD